jgi:hypothetical protein
MNLQSLVVVILRILSLDFLLRVTVQLTPQLLAWSRVQQNPLPDESSFQMAYPWLILGSLVVGAILLWVSAVPIARLVTRNVPQDFSFGAMSLADCYSFAFIGIGLFYMAGHFSKVITWTYYLFRSAASSSGDTWKEQVNSYAVPEAYIPFIVGIILFLNGRKWAVALARKQTASEKTV